MWTRVQIYDNSWTVFYVGSNICHAQWHVQGKKSDISKFVQTHIIHIASLHFTHDYCSIPFAGIINYIPRWVFTEKQDFQKKNCLSQFLMSLRVPIENIFFFWKDGRCLLGKGSGKKRIFYGLLPNPPSALAPQPQYGLFTDKKMYPYF